MRHCRRCLTNLRSPPPSTALRTTPWSQEKIFPSFPRIAIRERKKTAWDLSSEHFAWGKQYHDLADHDEPTIYALSTAPGRAAIAIIRISGPACLTVYRSLCPGKPLPRPRNATLRSLYQPADCSVDTQVLDSSALVLYFPAPETATGEDVLELHVHGGTAVVKAVLAAIPKSISSNNGQLPIPRYADPGEFTLRAFYNNRLDLTQVEALGDILSAETEQQRRLAVRGTTSALAERYESWRRILLYARGELEALIDFSEDQHFDESPTKLCESVAKQVQQLALQLQANIISASRGELLRNGISIALVGAPNAGKSSLLNQIVGRDAAIVSKEAGTTRDVVDVSVDIGGYLCRFGDLAGLRKASHIQEAAPVGEIEIEGMRRARERALTADVVIVILSAEEQRNLDGAEPSNINTSISAEVQELLEKCNPETQKVICVLNKTDLFIRNEEMNEACFRIANHPALQRLSNGSDMPVFPISCTKAQAVQIQQRDPGGLLALSEGLALLFYDMTSAVMPSDRSKIPSPSAWAESLGATERQRILLQQCLQHLEGFLAEVRPENMHAEAMAERAARLAKSTLGDDPSHKEDIDIVLAAESLRAAANCLAKITGRGEVGDVEEVLGVVFEKSVTSS